MPVEDSYIIKYEAHLLVQSNERFLNGKKARKSCMGCYPRLIKVSRTKKVTTKCNVCDKFYCAKCFTECHKDVLPEYLKSHSLAFTVDNFSNNTFKMFD